MSLAGAPLQEPVTAHSWISWLSELAKWIQRLQPFTPAGKPQNALTLYAGTGAPVNAQGVNGDIYLRSDGGAGTTLYQRRSGSWVGVA